MKSYNLFAFYGQPLSPFLCRIMPKMPRSITKQLQSTPPFSQEGGSRPGGIRASAREALPSPCPAGFPKPPSLPSAGRARRAVRRLQPEASIYWKILEGRRGIGQHSTPCRLTRRGVLKIGDGGGTVADPRATQGVFFAVFARFESVFCRFERVKITPPSAGAPPRCVLPWRGRSAEAPAPLRAGTPAGAAEWARRSGGR